MNILIVDVQNILSKRQASNARKRLFYSLARFSHRINGATIRFSIDDRKEQFNCVIDVNVEGSGIVSVRKSSDSAEKLMNLAVNAVEPKIACKVDWRSWFNAENVATWMLTIGQPFHWLSELTRSVTRRPIRHASHVSNSVHSSRRTGQTSRRIAHVGVGESRSSKFSA